MGWLKAAGAIVGGLFSPSEGKTTGGELLKDMSEGIDVMFYTDQEKAEDLVEKVKLKQKAFAQWLQMLPALKGSESQRSVTRRIIAIFVLLNIFALVWICVASEAYSVYYGLERLAHPSFIGVGTVLLSPLTAAILQISAAFYLGTTLICVIGFYFGPPLMNALRGK